MIMRQNGIQKNRAFHETVLWFAYKASDLPWRRMNPVFGQLPDKQTPVIVHRDGRIYTAPAGTEITVGPGESLTLYPGCYHVHRPGGGCLYADR